MSSPVPTTKLEAVNLMLGAIGQAPVSTLDSATIADADTAQRILDETSREIQMAGIHCNTEYNYTMVPDSNGNINLPTNCLKIDVDDQQANYAEDVAARGSKLYDLKNHTFTWTKSLKCVIVLSLDFTDLPEAVRWYITIRAARKLQDRILGANEIHAYTEADEARAKAQFLEAESDNGDYTCFDNLPAYLSLNRSSSHY